MAMRYGYFDSASNEYPYTSTDFGKLINGLLSDGIIKNYSNEFLVVRNGNNSVTVKSGRLWIFNHWVENDEDISLSFSTPNFNTGDKTLSVILRLDLRSGNEGVNIFISESRNLIYENEIVEIKLAELNFSVAISSSLGNYTIIDSRSFASSRVTPFNSYHQWDAEFKNMCESMMTSQTGYSYFLMQVVGILMNSYKILSSLNDTFTKTTTIEFSNSDYESGFDKYSETEVPTVRICGNVCYLSGSMRYFGNHGNEWKNGGAQIPMGKLPDGVPIPPNSVICKNHASMGSSYRFIIHGKEYGSTAGVITASRICGFERSINGINYTSGDYRPAVVGDQIITDTSTNRGEWFNLDSVWIVDQNDIVLEDSEDYEVFEDSLGDYIIVEDSEPSDEIIIGEDSSENNETPENNENNGGAE